MNDETTSASADIVAIRSFTTRGQAELSAAMLRSSGINSIVKGESESSYLPTGTVHVFVAERDRQAALALIGDSIELPADYDHGPGLKPTRARRAGLLILAAYIGVPFIAIMLVIALTR